ncbi:hypothetical protein AN640_01975 [Candidatus Epulonipiscium fishelsonii]|uniref:Uncharacterized protein n=1 Tax=Candidatus Epulonipiscium fishelsonii TaxID=77094 RepID=A0ACC8X9Q6_9FIRM|nr:hypothetical protein AN640_01975 [Epulopiscium sp. SCG-D08WGA-EpuloA1]
MEKKKFDEQIKNAFMMDTNNLELNDNLFNKIKMDIYNEENKTNIRGDIKMKKKLITGVLCLSIVSATVIGASYAWNAESHTITQNITTLPNVEDIESDYGFTPKVVDKFSNGFNFSSYRITSENISKDDDQINFNGLNLEYEKDNDMLHLSIEPIPAQFVNNSDAELIETINDINIYYLEQVYKVVPEGYVLTPEDEKQQRNGDLMISFGSVEETIESFQYMSWYEDGNLYSLLGFDCNISASEMVGMAEELINVK